ncbi:hypothetical protein HGP28_06575 [Vibrio sp. SM6]|uniref:Uncharacterized protein n=1 Tax=Vibrio agarilyticus TaxID=2726741 RepID=A0A7X8YGM3_9VIBR|nr:hypothetical protein [Vibrio agarilyticus]NLS12566.1 hypothetical protein [Vibrio agarilyticus]
MPAQKLTKARLVQILVMMILLIGAFSWRTLVYEPSEQVSCQLNETCNAVVSGQKISLIYNQTNATIKGLSNKPIRLSFEEQHSVVPVQDKWRIILKVSSEQQSLIEIQTITGNALVEFHLYLND